MSELTKDDTNSSARIENRDAKPSGVLPRNTQAMVVTAVAVIMVGAIAFSGSTAPKTVPRSQLPSAPSIIDPNQARIAEYRHRLDEQARKLAQEQEDFQRTKQQIGPPGQNAVPAGLTTEPGAKQPGYTPSDLARNTEDSIENGRRRRAYNSLFASNVALSYRNNSGLPSTPTSSAVPTRSRPAEHAANDAILLTPNGYFVPLATGSRILPDPPDEAASPDESRRPGQANVLLSQPRPEPAETPKPTPSASPSGLNNADGNLYRLFEGTIIETVLTNRLNGSFAGPINCIVSTNLYSHDAQHLLIPQGSRVLGEVKRVTTFGQERLSVAFHRLIMPDGFSVSLDQFQGLNQIGETGLRDQVNHHYLEVFGASLAIGAIAGLAQADTRSGFVQSSSDSYRQGVSDSLSRSSLRVLDRYLNILPTVTVREGHRVKVYLSNDLLLPAYENHRIPGDL